VVTIKGRTIVNDIIKTALSKAYTPVNALAPGKYQVKERITLEIEGTITKGADQSRIPTVDIPWKKVCAHLAEKLGCVGDAAINQLTDAIRDAMNNNKDKDTAIESHIKNLEAATKKVESFLGQLPPKTISGRTSVDVVVREVAL